MAAATLKDIAKLVGVSVNTVSRALKDKPDIGLETRERVKEAAAALGYRPNLNARSLVLQKSSTIGLAVTEADNPVRMEFCEKLRSYAADCGYRVLTISLTHEWSKGNREALEDLLARRVDGLIIGYIWGLTGEQPLGKILEECRSCNIPVTVFGTPETGMADCVEIDFFDSAYQLANHVIGQGYKDIAFFNSSAHSTRESGFLQAMAEHRIKGRAVRWMTNGAGLENAATAMTAYLKKHGRPPEAVIAFNDISAIGIMAALKQHGYRVPEDCAVAGFDNIEFGAYYDPPLTTIGFDRGVFARTVWELLFNRLNGSETGPAKRLKLHQELVVRKSC